ncbi:MAG: hypothetical protein V8S24_04410 [Gordonibacter pamelaeae]
MTGFEKPADEADADLDVGQDLRVVPRTEGQAHQQGHQRADDSHLVCEEEHEHEHVDGVAVQEDQARPERN